MLIEVVSPTPILNTSRFSFVFGGSNGHEIPLNERGHPFHYEFVALKETIFQIEEVLEQDQALIYKVSCSFYPKKGLYIDSRFTKQTNQFKIPKMPEPQNILERIKKMKGLPYVWGGNWSAGVPDLLSFYPPKKQIDLKTQILWTLKGVDCSGLLYEATDGASPRNTHQLIYFGSSLKNLSDLQPLDMIVYPGHVLFVLDNQTIIESKFPYGVIERSLTERLDEILKTRQKVDEWDPILDPEKHFTVRRFI